MGKMKCARISLFLFLGISNVNAAACDNALKVDYQNRAKNISYSYTYNDSNNTFNILFTNITDGLYLTDMDTMQEHKNNGEIIIYNVISGKSYRYGVFTSDRNPCSGSSIYNIYVTLPFYNPYYKDGLCEGINSYKYCKKFINKSVTYEEFVENVTNYKKSLEKQDDDTDVLEKTFLEKAFDLIVNFYLSYYFIILPIVILITVIAIIKENKKDSLF